MKTQTKRLTESAMLLAVAIVLELVSKMFIPELPFGGQITLMSMLPVVLISYRHGVKWGLVSGVTYALLEMALGAKTVAAAFQPGYFGDGVMLLNAFIMCVLDYLVAFTVLGVGGCFRNRVQNRGLALMGGSLVALGARYLAISNIDEARELRCGGIGLPILQLDLTPADQTAIIIANSITQAIYSENQAQAFSAEAEKACA